MLQSDLLLWIASMTVAVQILPQGLSLFDVQQLVARWLELAVSEVPLVPPHGDRALWPHHGEDAWTCKPCSCARCLVGAAWPSLWQSVEVYHLQRKPQHAGLEASSGIRKANAQIAHQFIRIYKSMT